MDRWERPQRPDELYHWVTPKTHRYIAKIGEGKDARYFYSQEELQAFKSGASNAASKAGQVAQRAVSNAHQRAANAVKTVKNFTNPKVAKDYQNRIKELDEQQYKEKFSSKRSKEDAGTANDPGTKEMYSRFSKEDAASAKAHAKERDQLRKEYQNKTLAGRMDQITGKSYKDRMNKLDRERASEKEFVETNRKYQNDPSYSKGARSYARDNANYSESEYNELTNEKARVRRDYEANTLAGRAEKAGRQINRKLDNAERSVKKAAKEAGDTASWVKKRVGEEAREAADSVSKAAKSAGSTVRDKAKEAYDYHVTGEGYKRDAKEQRKASRQYEKDSKDPNAIDRGQASKMAREYKESANKSEQNYKTKSVKGNAERASDFIAKHLKKKRKK